MLIFFRILFVCSGMFLISCQTAHKMMPDSEEMMDPKEMMDKESMKESMSEVSSVIQPLESSSKIIEQWKKRSSSKIKNVSIEQRPEVDMWIRYFTGRGRKYMKLYLERSHRYIDLMTSILAKEGLPQNLVYMVMIESGFNPVARSRAQATGYWQFIESTGRRYGLKIDGFIDERRDPLLSTYAATKYLKDLYSLFGSWYLVMASYNAGEYRVNKAMLRHYTRDFWKLTKKRSIPSETRNYVPKFMAAQMIAEDPEKYGFTDLKYRPPISFESVAIHRSVSLKKLANQLQIPLKDLKLLNPKYISNYVPLGKNQTAVLRVPTGYLDKVTTNVIAASFMKRPKYSHTYFFYKVRRGDTLYRLARRNRTSVNTIRRMNAMSSRSILRAGKVIKLPRAYTQNKKSSLGDQFHVVKRGESLGRIAKKYQVSVSNLRKWNGLKASSMIHPKQLLRVQDIPVLPSVHIVKRGESLTRIAKKYQVSVSNLRKWNGLKASSMIHPKQTLKLAAKTSAKTSSAVKTHIVKKGETLISISNKYKVPLLTLMKRNSLTFKSILGVGREIIIP